MQALMGGKDFCNFLQQLQAASPALSAPELPTLHALSALAAEFQAVTTSAESSGLQVQPLPFECSLALLTAFKPQYTECLSSLGMDCCDQGSRSPQNLTAHGSC